MFKIARTAILSCSKCRGLDPLHLKMARSHTLISIHNYFFSRLVGRQLSTVKLVVLSANEISDTLGWPIKITNLGKLLGLIFPEEATKLDMMAFFSLLTFITGQKQSIVFTHIISNLESITTKFREMILLTRQFQEAKKF